MISDRLTLVLLVSLAFLSSKSCEGVQVKITNHLGTLKDLDVHCQSKDDDLGVHVLRYNGSYQFSFKPNFWGTTLFFCDFWWAPQMSEVHRFDIYRSQRDWCGTCLWSISESGPCIDAEPYHYCFKWNENFENPF